VAALAQTAVPRTTGRGQVPDDWILACRACDEERRAAWLHAWRARSAPVRPEAAHVVPGHCQPGGPAMLNYYSPDSPRLGCTHPRQRGDGTWDYRYVPKAERPSA
jgi:hypothetical protein